MFASLIFRACSLLCFRQLQKEESRREGKTKKRGEKRRSSVKGITPTTCTREYHYIFPLISTREEIAEEMSIDCSSITESAAVRPFPALLWLATEILFVAFFLTSLSFFPQLFDLFDLFFLDLLAGHRLPGYFALCVYLSVFVDLLVYVSCVRQSACSSLLSAVPMIENLIVFLCFLLFLNLSFCTLLGFCFRTC